MGVKICSVEVFSAILYGVCSSSMNFLNKYLLTTWTFEQPAAIILVQLIINVTVIALLKTFRIIKVCSYNFKVAKSCGLLSILYSTNTILALFALTGMNVPMYIALRRCIPFASMVLGYIFFFKRPTTSIFASIVIITSGTFIASSGDLTFTLPSYTLGIVSVIFMALHLLVLKRNSEYEQLNTLDLLYVNSFNCIPIVLILATINIKETLSFPYLYDRYFLLSFLLVAVAGCLFNYSLFLCTTANSALTTSWVGVIKSGFTTVIAKFHWLGKVRGMFAFGGVQPTPLLLTGLTVNFTGCLLYAYAKYIQSKEDANLKVQEDIVMDQVDNNTENVEQYIS